MVSSIRTFFTPIVFNGDDQNKTLQQRALEMVDEYFNLGGVHQVTIFSPDETCDQFYSRENAEVSSRSWVNVALKITSYCTGILPLLAVFAKLALRSCLPSIGSEPTKSERVLKFFQGEGRTINDAVQKLLEVLGSNSREDVFCLGYIINFLEEEFDNSLGLHDALVERLTALPEGSLTAASLEKFIRYLGNTSLEGLYPHFVCEILNKYEGLCQRADVDLRSYVREYLDNRAESLIRLSDERDDYIYIQMTLAEWFELDVESMSQQVQEVISEAIKGRITGLRNTYCKPIIVELCTRIEMPIIKRPALADWMLQNEVIIVDDQGKHEIANRFSNRVVSTIADAKKLLTPRPNNPQDM